MFVGPAHAGAVKALDGASQAGDKWIRASTWGAVFGSRGSVRALDSGDLDRARAEIASFAPYVARFS
jgi:hypothetical protein